MYALLSPNRNRNRQQLINRKLQVLHNQWPPNIAEIVKSIGEIRDLNPVFTYGDKLYNPTGGDISEDLMSHEEEHEKQQAVYGVDNWWAKYLTDPTFRLTQEVEAYRTQLKSVQHWPRNVRRELLREMSITLSSKLYGEIVSRELAKDLIKHYV